MTIAAFVLSGVLLQVQALKSHEKTCPYVLVTTAGERIGSMDLPKHDGKPVKFRMCLNGSLTMFASADVNWGATEKANAAGPAPTPASGLAATPVRATLSGFAGQAKLLDPDGSKPVETPAPRKAATPTRTPSQANAPEKPH